MDRNKLLRIIQRDLNELTELTDEMADKSQASSLEIEFALGKLRIISQEFDYLKELSQQSLPHTEIKEPLTLSPSDKMSRERTPLADMDGDSLEGSSIWQRKNESFTHEISDAPAQPDSETEKEGKIEEKNAYPLDLEQDTPNENEILDEETHEPVDVKKTVAEIFIQEKSVNDSMVLSKTIDHQLADSPVTRLEAAIGLNDRFQFIRELFNNDARLFNHTVKQIDQMPDINAAVTYLNSNFKWKKNETSLKFAQLVKRRFSN